MLLLLLSLDTETARVLLRTAKRGTFKYKVRDDSNLPV